MATIVGKNKTTETLIGGDGADILIGGDGQNTLYGGGGADVFTVSVRTNAVGTGSYDMIEDFQIGIDKIDVSAFGISNMGQLKLILQSTGGTSTYFNAFYGTSAHTVLIRNVLPSQLSASDFIFSASGGRTETGTFYDDDLFGSRGNDIIDGGAGFDRLFGGDGDDRIIGGSGDNDLYGQGGSDIFVQSSGKEFVDSHDTIHDFQVGIDKIDISAVGISSFEQLKLVLKKSGNDSYILTYFAMGEHTIRIVDVLPRALSASDFIFDTRSAKTVNGTYFADQLFGSDGADRLNGLGGADQLFGGAGNDILTGGKGENLLYGQGGSDVFKASPRTVQSSEWNTIGDFEIGSDRIDVSAFGISSFDQIKLMLGVKNRTDAYFDARYEGHSFGFLIKGILPGQLTASSFIFDKGGAKNIVGTDWDDIIFGSRSADTLRGGGGNDKIFGGSGDDVLMDSKGTNLMYGQGGADTFRVVFGNESYTSSTSVIMDFVSGTDKIDVSALHISSFDLLKEIAFTSGNGTSKINVTIAGARNNIGASVEIANFRASNLKESDFIFYQSGARTEKGTKWDDLLFGGTSNDKLYGYDGRDILFGDAGNDRLYGGKGYDDLRGGKGDDVLIGGPGADKLDGGEGRDTASYEDAEHGVVADLENSSNNPNTIYNDAANDTYISIENLKGSRFADVLYGDAQANTLSGDGGNDQLFGGNGNDKLFGGDGNDKLHGGLGADKLTGGAGKDVFLFKALTDSTVASAGRDTILDFSGAGGDRIDLSAIDASTKTTGNQAFSFLGTAAFTGKAGELRYDKKTSDTYIYGDVDGDGKADFAIHLDDAVTLSKGYFVL